MVASRGKRNGMRLAPVCPGCANSRVFVRAFLMATFCKAHFIWQFGPGGAELWPPFENLRRQTVFAAIANRFVL